MWSRIWLPLRETTRSRCRRSRVHRVSAGRVYKHKDSRFAFRQLSSGAPSQLINDTSSVVLYHGGNTVSTWNFGSSGAPHTLMNLYWAAWKMWNKLKLSGRMTTYFTNVDLLAFEKTAAPYYTTTNCATSSCALAAMKNLTAITSPQRPAYANQVPTIILDGNAATPYSPQTRVMHEMGHIADFLSGPNAGLVRSTGYCYTGIGNCDWTYTSSEYRPTALTEGLATFLAVSAFHNDNTAETYVCTANGNAVAVAGTHCYPGGVTGAYTLEVRPAGACGMAEGRRALNAMRFFWDIYDVAADGTDATDKDFFNILDALSTWPCPAYPACYSAGQLHDQFTNVPSTLYSATPDSSPLTELDQGNAWSFRNVMLNNYTPSTDVQGAYYQNCMATY